MPSCSSISSYCSECWGSRSMSLLPYLSPSLRYVNLSCYGVFDLSSRVPFLPIAACLPPRFSVCLPIHRNLTSSALTAISQFPFCRAMFRPFLLSHNSSVVSRQSFSLSCNLFTFSPFNLSIFQFFSLECNLWSSLSFLLSYACSDDVELHVISLTYKDLAGLSKGDKHGESIDKATFLQNFPVPGLVGGKLHHFHGERGYGWTAPFIFTNIHTSIYFISSFFSLHVLI